MDQGKALRADARNRAPNLSGADMNISGLDKAVVLAALYNGSKQQGMGFVDKHGANDITTEQAREYIKERADVVRGMYFDYLNGRVMKIDLSYDEMKTAMYNRDNGEGAAEAIIEQIRASMPPEIKPSNNKPHFCHKHG